MASSFLWGWGEGEKKFSCRHCRGFPESLWIHRSPCGNVEVERCWEGARMGWEGHRVRREEASVPKGARIRGRAERGRWNVGGWGGAGAECGGGGGWERGDLVIEEDRWAGKGEAAERAVSGKGVDWGQPEAFI